MSGVAWDAETIVTGALERQRTEIVTVQSATGQDDRAALTIWGPRLPLAAITPGSSLPGLRPARSVTPLPEAGGWVLAVWRAGRERGFAPGTYLQLASTVCGLIPVQEVVSSLGLSRLMAGGGLFDIDGYLLAVILPCGNRVAAVATGSIEAILQTADTDEQRVLARYGLVLGALTDDELAFFRVEDGVIVREVWSGHRGDQAGVLPGDIVNAIDGAVVTTPGDLVALAGPPGDQPLALGVRRGSRTLTITLSGGAGGLALDSQSAPGAGLVWESAPRSYRIDSVLPGSRAAAAGVELGDRLVRVDHAEPRNLAQVQRLFADERVLPVLLEIERDGRRLAILVR